MWFAFKSIRSPHAISPVKAFEQVRHVLRCYSDSSVLDQERDESLLGLESYLNGARLGVTAGILRMAVHRRSAVMSSITHAGALLPTMLSVSPCR
jgi:hypothetical protein